MNFKRKQAGIALVVFLFLIATELYTFHKSSKTILLRLFLDFKFRVTEAAKKTPAEASICFISHGYLCA